MNAPHQHVAALPRASAHTDFSIAYSGFIPVLAWISASTATLPIDLTNPNLALTLMGIVLLESILIMRLWAERAVLRERARTTSKEDGLGNLAALYSKALTGSLDRFSVGEVLQFLNSIRETGILDIVDDGVSTVHRLLIDEGDIIDAYNGDKRGEEAVREILQCVEGSFTFIRGDLPSNERCIQKPTMTLLMEAYQHRDETRGIELGEQAVFAGQA